jgi:hypothetical protein
MITVEHAIELLGDESIPNDPYYHEFFLESLDDIYVTG